jgi:hypothetical protein
VHDAACAKRRTPAGDPYWNPPALWDLDSYWQTLRGAATLGLVDEPRGCAPVLYPAFPARFVPDVM